MAKDYRLGQIFREYGGAFIDRYRPHPTVQRAIHAIGQCRTERLGGKRITCRTCGTTHVVYASCGNRNCPICPALKKEIWLLRRQQEILPIKYYHVVFTVPHQFNDLIKNHPRLLYNILFRAAWYSLKTLLATPKWCGGEAGMLAVLHTWGQNLSYHPHLHCIVPAGGLSMDRQEWLPTKYDSVLVDVEILSELFRKTFIKMLREHWEEKGIDFRGKAAKYHELAEWRDLFISVAKPWVVYCKAPTAGARQTLDYLSRYTHAIAISEYRILELSAGKVVLRYKDYADKNEKGIPKKKELGLDYLEFIRRFVQHILPHGFHKIRYFGIWSAVNRKRKLQVAQRLLGQQIIPLTMQMIKALVKQKIGIDPTRCGACGSMDLLVEIIVAQTVNRRLNSSQKAERAPPLVVLSPSPLVKERAVLVA